MALLEHGLFLLVENLDCGKGHHRRGATVQLTRPCHVPRNGIRESIISTLCKNSLAVYADIIGCVHLAAIVHTLTLDLNPRTDAMDNHKLLFWVCLEVLLNFLWHGRERTCIDTLLNLTSRQGVFPVCGVNNTLSGCVKDNLTKIDRPIP